jgi:hypothetical protein
MRGVAQTHSKEKEKMKLNINGCREYAKSKGIDNYYAFAEELDLEYEAIRVLERGVKIGYDAVKNIYNKLGEKAVKKIIDFEEETLDGFKSKFVLVGDKLY